MADALSRFASVSVVDLAVLAHDQATDEELANLKNSTSLKIEPMRIANATCPIYCDVSVPNRFRPFVPKKHRFAIMQQLHGMAHPGARTTRRLITEKFIWPGNYNMQTSCIFLSVSSQL